MRNTPPIAMPVVPEAFARVAWPAAVLALAVLAPPAHAGWGSLRGNDRGSAPARSAPRPSPPPARSAPRPGNAPARSASRPVQSVQKPANVEQARAEQADRQRMDIAPERSQASYWSGYRPGMRVDRLPDGIRRIAVRGHAYFYFGGLFYDQGPSGYVVIAPPLGAEIPDLPTDVQTVVVGDSVYYYAAGAFYVQQPDGSYAVVAPPLGATVSLLPPDAVPEIINGVAYYQADGVYYVPVMQNGAVAYLTVPQP